MAAKSSVTPVMRQFFAAKQEHPDAILFFRMGDFYEMFYDDALTASKVLDIALTSRGTAPDGSKIPMAGVPHHAATGYLTRLLASGRKVAICEQIGDPKMARGIVPREVVRVATPGLCLEAEVLDAKRNNYLASVQWNAELKTWALAALELSTAELLGCDLPSAAALLAELTRLDPREVLAPAEAEAPETKALRTSLETLLPNAVWRVDHAPLEPKQAPQAKPPFDATSQTLSDATQAAAARALAYARRSFPGVQLDVSRLVAYEPGDHLFLDDAAVRNLELERTLDGERSGALLALLDQTRTPMGARLLRRELLAPITDIGQIRRRHDTVEELTLRQPLRTQLRDALRNVGDIERQTTRAVAGLATPRELGSLRDSLRAARSIRSELEAIDDGFQVSLGSGLARVEHCAEILADLEQHLVPEPPMTANGGGIFASGIHDELDQLSQLASDSKDVIVALEQREREATSINSLKVRFTRVFGYYIEVTRPNLHLVPERYRRKQTVAGGERFTTDELSELQERITTADESRKALEADLYEALRQRVARAAPELRATASALAELDVRSNWAELAGQHNLVRPLVDESECLELYEARHPVVEASLPAGTFVPNDVRLDTEAEHLMMLTGPNMSGKSTVMRQTALAVIMAQAGGFVAATQARIGIVDRLFTRIGSSDNLTGGQSTFMVEMRETATILDGATRRSLVLVDEVGRGTSTLDGLAIASAVAEYLHDHAGCRVLFATHFHQLCRLAENHPGIANYNALAREHGDEVVFLHKIERGAADRSYGIAVAGLAGLPVSVIRRAQALARTLEHAPSHPMGASEPEPGGADGTEGTAQLDLLETAAQPRSPTALEQALEQLDPDRLSPLEALIELHRLKQL